MKKIFLGLIFAIFTSVNCSAQNSASIYKKSNIFSRNNAVSIGMTVGMSETPCLFDSNHPGGVQMLFLGQMQKFMG